MEKTHSAAATDGCISSTKLHALAHFGSWDSSDFHR